MPLYEYKCLSCGKIFELRQKFSDTPLSVHDECGGALEKIISAPTLQFKGSGWYVNDYGRGDHKPGSNGKSESHKDSKDSKDSKTEAKGETKPEAKSDTKTESKAPAASSADK
jgi:putative FmdB family regulatory protein